MLSLLKDSSGLSHEQFEFVDMAKASCEMLIRIVDDLLNFSKLEADKVTLEYIPLCFEEILGGKRLPQVLVDRPIDNESDSHS